MGIHGHIGNKDRKKCWLQTALEMGWVYSVFVFALTGLAHGQTGVSNNAPAVSFYAGLGESCCGEDPHPVHGIATPDGGYILVGKTATSNGGWGGFAVKLGPPNPIGNGIFIDPNDNPSFRWVVRTPEMRGRSAFLNAAATRDAVLIAGFTTDAGQDADMYLAKHSLADGRLIWEKRFADTVDGRDGAIEAIQITKEGGLVVGAVINAPRGGLEGFKSFGNPGGGQSHIFYLSAGQVQSDSAPEEPTWSITMSEYETVKGVRPVPGAEGGYVALIHAEDADPTLIRLDVNGQTRWSQSYPGRFEPTDITVNTVDGQPTGFTFTGHGGNDGTLDGQLTHVDLEGNQVWAKSFGNPAGGVGLFEGLGAGNPKLIYDECWGIQGTPDGGVVVSCGTGIEGCELWDAGSPIRQECDRDPRKTWRGYVVRFDAGGDAVWQRVDSFMENGVPEVADSASEYVFLTTDGRVASVVDQGFGIGLLVTEPDMGLAQKPEDGSGPVGPIEDASDEAQSPAGEDPTVPNDEYDLSDGDDEDINGPQAQPSDDDSDQNESAGASAAEQDEAKPENNPGQGGLSPNGQTEPEADIEDDESMDLSAGCDQSNSRDTQLEFALALLGLLALRGWRRDGTIKRG